MKARRRMASVLVFVLFLLVSLIMLFPVYYLIIGSLQDGQEIFRAGMKFFLNPGDMKWSNYPNLFTYNNGIYTRWFSNSVFYAVAFTVCALAFSSLVGYGLGAYDFKGKNAIFVLVLAVMMKMCIRDSPWRRAWAYCEPIRQCQYPVPGTEAVPQVHMCCCVPLYRQRSQMQYAWGCVPY